MCYNNSMTFRGLELYALYCNNASTKFRIYHGLFAKVCGPKIMAFIEEMIYIINQKRKVVRSE